MFQANDYVPADTEGQNCLPKTGVSFCMDYVTKLVGLRYLFRYFACKFFVFVHLVYTFVCSLVIYRIPSVRRPCPNKRKIHMVSIGFRQCPSLRLAGRLKLLA